MYLLSILTIDLYRAYRNLILLYLLSVQTSYFNYLYRHLILLYLLSVQTFNFTNCTNVLHRVCRVDPKRMLSFLEQSENVRLVYTTIPSRCFSLSLCLAIVYQLLSRPNQHEAKAVYNHWTGPLEWTIGLINLYLFTVSTCMKSSSN